MRDLEKMNIRLKAVLAAVIETLFNVCSSSPF